MAQKMEFTQKSMKGLKGFILKQKNRTIFNFLNLYSVYLYRKNKEFKNAIDGMRNKSLTLADGSIVSIFLRTKRIRGTDFTIFLVEDKELIKGKRNFFIGLTEKDLDILSKKFNLERKNLFAYNPPYIKKDEFPEEEIEKMGKLINSKKIDYLWVGVGNPKQEILAGDLYDKINVRCMFNVGAALDFLIGKKKESPKTIQRFGLEWLYRGITDFKHSNKKVLRSFVGLFYMPRTVKLIIAK